MDDERWEPGMPVLDRQPLGPPPSAARAGSTARAGRTASPARTASPGLPASLQGLPPRSVPETAPTPLQRHYINLSVVALIAGAIAITALELGAPLASPVVKVGVLVAAPIIILTTADAAVRIWRSAWAWMPVDRGKGLFRLAWLASAGVFIAATTALAAIVVLA